MSVHQKRKNKIEHEFNAGGTDYVPPALCPRPAHVSACTPAYANDTGRAGRHDPQWVRPWVGHHPLLTWEAAC